MEGAGNAHFMYIVLVSYGHIYVTLKPYEIHIIMRKLRSIEINLPRMAQILSSQIK